MPPAVSEAALLLTYCDLNTGVALASAPAAPAAEARSRPPWLRMAAVGAKVVQSSRPGLRMRQRLRAD